MGTVVECGSRITPEATGGPVCPLPPRATSLTSFLGVGTVWALLQKTEAQGRGW